MHASANRRFARHGYTPDSNKPLGMKVDGIFQIPGNDDLEVGFVEISGGPSTNDRPRYLKDHVRGVLGLRDLVDETAVKLASGDLNTLRRMKIWFVHVYGKEGYVIHVCLSHLVTYVYPNSPGQADLGALYNIDLVC